MAKASGSAQVLKGLLDTLVLRVLGKEDNYGFGIMQSINEWLGEDGAVLKEATLYPLLHRLEARELVETYWKPGQRGTDRKYYRVTAEGRRHLKQRIDDWRRVARILRTMFPKAEKGRKQ